MILLSTTLSVANIIFSLIFVLYYDLNVLGVALGTLVASTLSMIIFLFYTFYALSKIKKLEFNTKKIFNVCKDTVSPFLNEKLMNI